MKAEIREQKENPLFKRNEVKVDVSLDITPSREEAERIICDNFSCKSEVVRINRISSNFGTKTFTIIADIYDSEEGKKNYSPNLKKKDIELDKKREEAKKPKEEPKEEVKAEVKEEPKVEEAPVETPEVKEETEEKNE